MAKLLFPAKEAGDSLAQRFRGEVIAVLKVEPQPFDHATEAVALLLVEDGLA
jgi:hypothetical protein